jgi:hypothetical protein
LTLNTLEEIQKYARYLTSKEISLIPEHLEVIAKLVDLAKLQYVGTFPKDHLENT